MEDFLKYLSALKLTPKSLKNYKSDISHFAGWAILKIRTFGSYIDNFSQALPFLSKPLVEEYMAFMQKNSTPPKTINRRLSTLRHLSRHLIASQIVDSDFMSGVENISFAQKSGISQNSVVNDFRSYLEAEKVSSNTIKNYLSDVRQFLTWLENNQPVDQSLN